MVSFNDWISPQLPARIAISINFGEIYSSQKIIIGIIYNLDAVPSGLPIANS